MEVIVTISKLGYFTYLGDFKSTYTYIGVKGHPVTKYHSWTSQYLLKGIGDVSGLERKTYFT